MKYGKNLLRKWRKYQRKMIFKIEGKISYNGPSDPPGEYYGIDLPDGKHINIGFDAAR